MAREGEGIMRCVAADHRSSADMDMLSNFKTALRRHLGVRVALDVKRCIACTRAHTWSLAGTFQHRKTGLCETCWCVLAKSPSEDKNNEVLTVCDRLQDGDGCEFMYQWLTVTNCIRVEQLSEYAIRSWLHLVCCFWNTCVARHLATGISSRSLRKSIAFVASGRLRTMSFPSGARAAVGRALLSSHRRAEERSCLAARTPLRAVCCFRRIRHPLASARIQP